MTPAALLIGGLIPAVLLGLGTVLMRASLAAGAGIAGFLAVTGTTVALIGIASLCITAAPLPPPNAILLAMLMGLGWSGAITCMAYGLSVLHLPVAVIAPLTNSNALIAVTLGAILFAEWQDLKMPLVVLGTLLICAGATAVSLAR